MLGVFMIHILLNCISWTWVEYLYGQISACLGIYSFHKHLLSIWVFYICQAMSHTTNVKMNKLAVQRMQKTLQRMSRRGDSSKLVIYNPHIIGRLTVWPWETKGNEMIIPILYKHKQKVTVNISLTGIGIKLEHICQPSFGLNMALLMATF